MSKYKGATVNERLYISGRLDDFYMAVEKKNIDEVKKILVEVELKTESINEILKHFKLLD